MLCSYLLSAYQRALTGKPLHASVAYFADHERFARLTGTQYASPVRTPATCSRMLQRDERGAAA